MSEDPKLSTKYVMVESGPLSKEEEFDIFELIRTLFQSWKIIASTTVVCIGLAVAYALYMPDVFKAETLLSAAQEEKSVASSALGQFGGFAAMAGVAIPTDSNTDRVLATLETRVFLKEFIQEKISFLSFLMSFGMKLLAYGNYQLVKKLLLLKMELFHFDKL